MWWDPQNAQQAETRQQVDRLLTGYRGMLSQLDGEPPVWGVGSAVGVTGEWLPLILVSHDELIQTDPGIPVGAQMTYQDLVGRFTAVNRVVTTIGAWGPVGQVLVRAATRPIPASRTGSGSVVREVPNPPAAGPPRVATVGLPCRVGPVTMLNGFITAGHLVSQVGDRVQVAGTDDDGQPVWIGGTVAHWSDPAATAPIGEWDYAVVELDGRATVDPVAHAGCQAAPTLPHVPFNVSLDGAVSRHQYGMVDGALNQLGDTSRQWLNCWSLAPSYLLKLGDSGSVALAAGPGAPTVFGHFVGGQQWAGYGLLHLYVQDLASCLAAGLGLSISI